MELEDLLKLFDSLGISKEDLEKALKEIDTDADAEDIAEAIGKVLGKFGSGVASGATGLDSRLLSELLKLFGPLAQDLLKRLLEDVLGEKKGFKTRKPGETWRRERINREGPGFEEDFPPDVDIQSAAKVTCGDDGQLKVTLKMAVRHREETITKLKLTGYTNRMEPVTLASKLNYGNNALTKANANPGDWAEFEISFSVPCELAIMNGGTVMMQYTIWDEDGNYTTDFEAILCTDVLIDPEGKCCKNFKIEEIRSALLGGLTDAIKAGKFSLDDLLKKITDPAEEEDNKAPNPPAKDVGRKAEESAAKATKATAKERGAELPRRVRVELDGDDFDSLKRLAALEAVELTQPR